ncbi:heterokaryon incompatibility protein-domain-containing protein [Xylariaceae sp. FL1272]|nr:heterokaryon incompatibility protein-domain-containing protein [Xylariaceae sp. FL1272]
MTDGTVTTHTIECTKSQPCYKLPILGRYKSIRVLKLEHAANWDAPLVGELEMIGLDQDNVPSFTALSYVWGSSLSTENTITCGTHDLDITANCRDALRDCRKHFGAISIWVDAICINQSCMAERNHQVPLMEEIYSRADRVDIWLGNETLESNQALECVLFASEINYLPFDRSRASSFIPRPLQWLLFALKLLLP